MNHECQRLITQLEEQFAEGAWPPKLLTLLRRHMGRLSPLTALRDLWDAARALFF